MMGVFFSENKKTAKKRIKKLVEVGDLPRGTYPRIAKKQIAHIDDWKTFEYVKKKKKR